LEVQLNPTKSTVSVSVSVSDTVKEITNNINTRKLKFAQSLIPFVSIYGNELIRNFATIGVNLTNQIQSLGMN
jgi:hypothetical protein